MSARTSKLVRCAIYTRVSTDQGLEQDFNSLDAQYDASQAYIRSQVHAGWTLLRGSPVAAAKSRTPHSGRCAYASRTVSQRDISPWPGSDDAPEPV